ncbi:SLC13 family permease [Alteraurantiacibacter buctensis]|uniref:SLC13 family permease n=1 Tax=Alteraurantiacibacter buctensis TaxID=1503981 RepID=A0A844YSK3_9SPHN|nr:SLC13 family permease [Alteraurantiacibacter buctensis]MXO70062.1 SLC13 family permease [Alteraurantiacibacter buctensis]
MTTPQWLSIATLAGMMILFVWGRFRYDVTALIALLAALALGIVAPEDAFTGFADDIVIIVGSALVVSAAIQRSGVVESMLASVAQFTRRLPSQLLLLTTTVGVLSGMIKNVGALAMLMPAAFQMAKRSGNSPSRYLMPMSFASLLGGLTTLVGTSPNIIVSRVREDMTGQPFGMFDYLPTGLGLLVVGLIFLRFGYRLLPSDRAAAPQLGDALDISAYVTEVTIAAGSPAIGETVDEFSARHEEEVAITGLLRGNLPGQIGPHVRLREGDRLILAGEPDALERAIASGRLVLEGEGKDGVDSGDGVGVLEAVVKADSALVGRTAGRLLLRDRFGINLIAVSRAGEHLTRRIGQTVLQAGDVIVLQGPMKLLPDRLTKLGALPLAQRQIRLGSPRHRYLPVIILATAIAATATGLVPVAVAFFAAAALMLASGVLPVDEAYEAVDWPILIMLGALIPVSASLESTGAAAVIADLLSTFAATLPAWGAVALILVAAMAVTPFLNNAATVLVMAPIAVVFAQELGYRPEPFLIAIAVGAGCDFLTPIGHQCNTLVFGAGGYRFSDYARLGAPLSLLVIVLGTPLILWVWPL